MFSNLTGIQSRKRMFAGANKNTPPRRVGFHNHLPPIPKPIAKAKPSLFAQRLELVITAANSASMGMIFAFRQFLPAIFRGLGRAILFPFNAACNLSRAVLALYEAHKEGYKAGALIRFLVAAASGLAISIAIAGALLAPIAFRIVGPILSVIGFSLRSLFHSISAIYFALHARWATNAADKGRFWDKVISNSVSAIQSIMNVIAIAMVLIAMVSSYGIMGLVAGAIGACYQIYRAANLAPPATKPEAQSAAEVPLQAKVDETLPREQVVQEPEVRPENNQTQAQVQAQATQPKAQTSPQKAAQDETPATNANPPPAANIERIRPIMKVPSFKRSKSIELIFKPVLKVTNENSLNPASRTLVSIAMDEESYHADTSRAGSPSTTNIRSYPSTSDLSSRGWTPYPQSRNSRPGSAFPGPDALVRQKTDTARINSVSPTSGRRNSF